MEFHTEQLQMIEQQISAELRTRELATYKQNMQLKQKNAALATSYQKKVGELEAYQERDQALSQLLQNIALELPSCNIEFAEDTSQKLRKVANRAKALEDTVVKMDEEVARMKADHDTHITELEARARDTSQEEQRARIEAFRLTAAQMQSCINEATSVLTDAMSAWSELDEPPQRVDIQRNIQAIENTTMAMKEEMKSLAALQRMKKTKEMNQLQQEAQQLRTKELHITDLLQPFQEKITDLVDAVE